MEANKKIGEELLRLRDKNPLVHHITNYVTANDCANITLAIGASPVMADDINEVRDITAMVSSLVINLGTLSKQRLEAMLAAAYTARGLRIPVVLDLVGVGAIPSRLAAAYKIIEEAEPAVVKGNMSEVKALYGMDVKAKGVDAALMPGSEESEVSEAASIAKELAKKLRAVIVITGKVDIITDGEALYRVENGNYMMSRVTGAGCMCTSLIASYIGAGAEPLTAALAGVVSMGIAGDVAFERLNDTLGGTGSFKVYLIDAIYNLTEKAIIERGIIHEA